MYVILKTANAECFSGLCEVQSDHSSVVDLVLSVVGLLKIDTMIAITVEMIYL